MYSPVLFNTRHLHGNIYKNHLILPLAQSNINVWSK